MLLSPSAMGHIDRGVLLASRAHLSAQDLVFDQARNLTATAHVACATLRLRGFDEMVVPF